MKPIFTVVLFLLSILLGNAQSIDSTIKKVNQLCKDKDYHSAVSVLNAAVKEHPQSDSLYYYLGMIYTDYLGKHDEAISFFRKSVEMNKRNAYGYFGLGKACIELNKLDSAILFLNEACKLKPDFLEGWHNLGYAWYLKGDENQKDLKNAIEYFTKALAINDTLYNTSQMRGMSYFLLDKYAEAAKDFELYEAFHYNKDIDSSFYYYAGVSTFQLKDYESAEYKLDTYLKFDSVDVSALVYRGLAGVNNGENEVPVKCLKKAVSLDSTNALAYYYLGLAYYNAENLLLAYPCFKKAAELGDKEAVAMIKKQYSPKLQRVANAALKVKFVLHAGWSVENDTILHSNNVEALQIKDTYAKLNIAIVKGNTDKLPWFSVCGLNENKGIKENVNVYNTLLYQWKRTILTDTCESDQIKFPITILTFVPLIPNTKTAIYFWFKPEDFADYQVYIQEFMESVKLE